MERISMINRVELIGHVGSVSTSTVSGRRAANFTVATSVAYKDADGSAVINTTWVQVTAFEGGGIDLDGLQKGSPVHVTGRMRNIRYTAPDGTVKSVFDVLASTVEKIEAKGLQYEVLDENS